MKTVEVYIAAAFCKENSGGNKAGVVLLSSELCNDEKMQIAEKLGFSETAFLSESSDADWRFEYFTPTEEVPLCGHATIAAFRVLRQLGLLKKPKLQIETKAGLLNVCVYDDGSIFMEQNLPQFYEQPTKEELEHCLQTKMIDEQYPLQIVSTGLKDILVPMKSPQSLWEMQPDFDAMSQLSRDYDVIGVHAYALTSDDETTAVCRNFAPLYGIDEESATGTSNCALACLLFQHGLRQQRYVFEQGHVLGAVSHIVAELESTEDKITQVRVGGKGCLLEKRMIELP